MKIPLIDLKRQYSSIKDEIDKAIQRVMTSSSFILGDDVTVFEESFAKFCNAKYCVGVSSGTDALYLSLKTLNIGPSDEVIIPANTFIATALAISYCGAKPVLVDCGVDYNINTRKIERSITKKTKVIIPVHLYGQPAEMSSILRIAKKYNLNVIEDACQAHGAEYKGQKVGTLGDIGCFSFYPAKNLGAYGDAGAMITNNSKLMKKIMLYRNYGQEKKYFHKIRGYNKRLDTIQAAILAVKLKYLEKRNKQRRRIAHIYNELLSKISGIEVPKSNSEVTHVYHLYVIRSNIRDKLMKSLNSKGVSTGIHYPTVDRIETYFF